MRLTAHTRQRLLEAVSDMDGWLTRFERRKIRRPFDRAAAWHTFSRAVAAHRWSAFRGKSTLAEAGHERITGTEFESAPSSSVPSRPNSAVRGGANPWGYKVSSHSRRSRRHAPSPHPPSWRKNWRQ